jgi:hypothetical protein
VQAYKFHLKRFMKGYYAAGNYLDSLEKYLSVSDNEILSALRQAAHDSAAEGHADADAIMRREKRFVPRELDPSIDELKIKEMMLALAIPSDAVFWTLFKRAENKELAFPVLLPSGSISDAAQLSQISIPSGKKNWIFLSPEWEKPVAAYLQKGLYV